MVVCKFGGSSVADEKQIMKVKAILENNIDRRIAIVSAPGKRNKEDRKITDMLYECNSLVQKNLSCKRVFAEIGKRYLDIAVALKLDTKKLTLALDEVRRKIDAGEGTDYAASRGEYLSGLLIAEYLGWEFVDPENYIVINSDGTVNPISYERLGTRLSTGSHYVIPGFYGATPEGRIKTFSRGGSDISGAIAARAVNADLYENWTDVSGFLLADPSIIRDPKKIHAMTFGELRELSYRGASVLHEEAVFPVRREGIPIQIRNTNDPADPGTIIRRQLSAAEEVPITGIAGKKEFAAISIAKNCMNSEIGFIKKLLEAFEENKISFEHLPSGIDTVSVILPRVEYEEKKDAIMASLRRLLDPDKIEVDTDLALVTVVGRGMRSV
ncbi:aspartate kinase, partial [Bullifex porci]|uniref:aspartate kinase n=1 Tax=Bullifex porci TaxID=2606638 RepID=UPI0023F10213